MKRLASMMLIMIIIAGICTTAVTAAPTSNVTTDWVLSDSGNNIRVEIIQYPKITMIRSNSANDKFPVDETVLHEIILEMDLAAAQKYFQYFESGESIPKLVLNGINNYKQPVFKMTLENCMIYEYTVTDLFTVRALNPVKAIIRLNAAKLTTTKLNTAGAPLQVTPIKKLDMAKVLINDTECAGIASLSGIGGIFRTLGSANEIAYGSVEFNSSELLVDYNEIGMLPDWLAYFDGKIDYTTSADPQCKLRYELSSTVSEDKLSFEVNLNAIGQELTEYMSNTLLVKYTFEVIDFNFVVPSAADSTAVETTTADSTPVEPANLLKRGSNLNRMLEYGWAGNWITTFGNMSIKQNETKVTGEYGNPIETLEGTASGNKLVGTWHDRLSSGKFEFTMSADGKSFSGTMYNQALGERGTFEWNGDREW